MDEVNENIDRYGDNNGASFPNQRLDITKRDKTFYQRCIDFALKGHFGKSPRIGQITKMKYSYNGYISKTDAEAFNYLNAAYGGTNKARYKDYRLSRKIIQRILGEWLQRPLNASVYTVNSTSKTYKARINAIKTGMQHPQVKKNVEKLRSMQIVDPFDGMTFEDKEQEQTSNFSQMSDKTKNEYIMQLFLNDEIKRNGLKDKLYMNLQDLLLGSEAFGMVGIGKDGKEFFRPIDIRRRVLEESENDPYGLRSPYIGEERPMYIHEVIQAFPKLTEEDIEKIKSWQGKGSDMVGTESTSNYFNMVEGQLMVSTFTLEWYSFYPYRRKIETRNGVTHKAELSPEYYEDKNNRKKLDKGEKDGKWKIEVKWKKILCQCTKIGPDIYTEFGKVPGMIGSIEKPFETKTRYTTLLFDTVAGQRVSLMELLEEIKEQYNICRFIINRELAKAKGLVITYDRAFLPRVPDTGEVTDMNKVLYKMINDGIYDYNSAADGNFSGETIDPKNAIAVHDLGVSNAMKVMIELGYNLEDMADKISGINQERKGDIPASSTVTNATNNLINSQSMTAPLFYFFDRYAEQVMLKLVEYKKIVYTLLHPEDGENIIGDEALGYLQATKDVSNDDYGVYISDSRKEENIRKTMRTYMAQAINAGEQTTGDAYRAEMAETVQEAQAILDKGWKDIKTANMQVQQLQLKKNQETIAGKAAMIKEDREDKQRFAANLEVLKANLDRGTKAVDALNEYLLNEQLAGQEQALASQQMEAPV